MSKEIYDNDALEKFRFVQRMAYEAVTEVKAELYEGITEKEAADRINQKVKDKGGNYLKWREK
jgi:Tfp pilus assembly protein FimV